MTLIPYSTNFRIQAVKLRKDSQYTKKTNSVLAMKVVVRRISPLRSSLFTDVFLQTHRCVHLIASVVC
jgi:hypothetical protein